MRDEFANSEGVFARAAMLISVLLLGLVAFSGGDDRGKGVDRVGPGGEVAGAGEGTARATMDAHAGVRGHEDLNLAAGVRPDSGPSAGVRPDRGGGKAVVRSGRGTPVAEGATIGRRAGPDVANMRRGGMNPAKVAVALAGLSTSEQLALKSTCRAVLMTPVGHPRDTVAACGIARPLMNATGAAALAP
jgi:hypothetical protein